MEMSFDRILGVVGILVGIIGIAIGVGVAVAMDPKSKGEMVFSVGCFVFSALVLCLTVGTWGFLTKASITKRILFASPLFALICLSMVEASRWAETRYRGPESKGAASASNDEAKEAGSPAPSSAVPPLKHDVLAGGSRPLSLEFEVSLTKTVTVPILGVKLGTSNFILRNIRSTLMRSSAT
jgi:hypothetical protein